MEVDSDTFTHVPSAPRGAEQAQTLVAGGRGRALPWHSGWAQPLPQRCPVLMPWDPGRTLTSSALITNEDSIFREPRIARTILKARVPIHSWDPLLPRKIA